MMRGKEIRPPRRKPRDTGGTATYPAILPIAALIAAAVVFAAAAGLLT